MERSGGGGGFSGAKRPPGLPDPRCKDMNRSKRKIEHLKDWGLDFLPQKTPAVL